MKSSIILYMLVGITIHFASEVRPLPQEQPHGMTLGADCHCGDGVACADPCSCSCESGTCIGSIIADLLHFYPKLGWSHCVCPDGSTCNGKESCDCDVETGGCVAFKDCSSTPTADPDLPTTTTTPHEPYGALCDCPDGTGCGGVCSCDCTTGTCTANSFWEEASDEGEKSTRVWSHCKCSDGSKCDGKTSCHCDEETGACVGIGEC